MALFRRNKKQDDVAALAEDDSESAEPASTEPASGPFDEADGHLADSALPRLDLGSLRIPGIPGIDLQVEADPNSGQVVAVTAIQNDGAVQLQVFAAPRSESLWDELRAEMLAELQKGTLPVEEAEGAFGPELRAMVPAVTPDGQQAAQPVRFTGVDGPRWFLRMVFMGRAAVAPDPADDLHRMIREVVVVRGGEAKAPRQALELRLPSEATASDDDAELEEVDEDSEDDGRDYGQLDPFERGPEITEIR
ncbi:MAG: DUF3710 domain-containing protein [Candidatus Nanopelagicales bacterium]